jgi:hypothetical protein
LSNKKNKAKHIARRNENDAGIVTDLLSQERACPGFTDKQPVFQPVIDLNKRYDVGSNSYHGRPRHRPTESPDVTK